MAEKRSVTELVRSGDYYKHAFIWYYGKYIMPFVHRTYWFILFIIAVFVAYISIHISFLDMQKKVIPFPMFVQDNLDTFRHIQSLYGDGLDIDQAVSRYLLAQYVVTRESFNSALMEDAAWQNVRRKVESFSSRHVYAAYRDAVDINQNPNSPLLQFGRNMRRDVQIDHIVFPRNTQEQALVYFTANISNNSGIVQQDRLLARVGYIMTDSNSVVGKDANFKFLITSYSVESAV